MLRVEFASGRPKLPFDARSVAITSGGTTTATYTLYLALQGQNPIGFNLPSDLAGSFTITPGQQMVITIQGNAKLPGESWQNLVISASTTNDPTTLVQLAKLPGTIRLPATITLDNDNAFSLSAVVPTQSALPTNPINGQLRGVADLSYVYEFDVTSALTPNNTTVLAAPNGRWLRRGAVFGTDVDDVTGAGGCAQDIRDIDPSQVRAPLYAADRSVGLPTRFWLNNTDVSAVPSGKRVGLIVLINGEPKSQTFDSLFLLVFRGYANPSTGALRTTRADGSAMDGVDEQIRFSANKSNLILQDALQPGEAYTLDVAPNFDIFDFSGRDLPDRAVISVFPFLYTQSGSYSEAGAVVGDVIYPEGDRRLIVPSIGLSVLALQGSGIVDSFGFLGVAPRVVTGLAANTAGQVIAINHDGEVAVRPLPLPSTEAIRALVGTIDGVGNASSLSASTAVSSGSILSVTCTYPCSSTGVGTIRLNYPDAKIAGLAKGSFNVSRVTLYLRRTSDGQLRSFAGNAVIANTSQTFTISSWVSGTVIAAIPANLDPAFGLFTPGGCTLAQSPGSSDFIADSYQAAFAFEYQNATTSISHDESLGCLLTATASLAGIEMRSRYWAESVADMAALRAVSLAKISPGQTRRVATHNKLYTYDPVSSTIDDDYNFSKPNEIEVSSPGRWILNDTTRWYSGSGAPAATLGEIGAYYLDTDSTSSTVGVVFKKADIQTWNNVGNIRGTPGTIRFRNVTAIETGIPPTITNVGTPTAAVLDIGLPKGNPGPVPNITFGSVITLASGSQASVTNTSADPANPILNFAIPKADAAATIGIGSVVTLGSQQNATVQNSGNDSNVILDFGIPAGAAGVSFRIRNVTTLPPGSSATATNAGTLSDVLLDLGIPQGATGNTGVQATLATPGIIQLAGDLSGTFDAPTVPGLATHVSSTSNPHRTTAAQVGSSQPLWNASQLQSRAISDVTPLDGQSLVWSDGTGKWLPGSAAAASVPDAGVLNKGVVQLAKDLSGLAASPIVIGLQGRPLANSIPTNGQTIVWDSTGSTWKPGTVTATIPDATILSKGVIRLGGELGGTADQPTITSNTTPKWNANQLQGHNVAFGIPTNRQVLGWNDTANRWEPQTISLPPALDASTSSKGVVKLAGDLGGTANAPEIITSVQPKWNAYALQGRNVIDTDPLDGETLVWNTALKQWQPGIVNTSTSANLSRTTTLYTTATLSPNTTENASIVLGKSFALYSVETDVPAWIRVYGTARDRTADASRVPNQKASVNVNIQSETITSFRQLKVNMRRTPVCVSFEDTPSSAISIAITNLSNADASINVIFTKLTLEN